MYRSIIYTHEHLLLLIDGILLSIGVMGIRIYSQYLPALQLVLEYTNDFVCCIICWRVLLQLVVARLMLDIANTNMCIIAGLFISGLGHRVFNVSGGIFFRMGFGHLVYWDISMLYFEIIGVMYKRVLWFMGGDNNILCSLLNKVRYAILPNLYRLRGLRFIGETISLREGKRGV